MPPCTGKSRQNVTPSSSAVAPISILQGITGSQPSSGSFVGSAVGIPVGVPVEGEIVGLDVGMPVEGLSVGAPVGLPVGNIVGSSVGEELGSAEGLTVGSSVGLFVGHGPHKPTSRASCTRSMASICEDETKLVRGTPRFSGTLYFLSSTYVNKQ
jgi:hypothetical protein